MLRVRAFSGVWGGQFAGGQHAAFLSPRDLHFSDIARETVETNFSLRHGDSQPFDAVAFGNSDRWRVHLTAIYALDRVEFFQK